MSALGAVGSLTASATTGRNMPSATTPDALPFRLRAEHVDSLAHSDGFSILRDHLAENYTYRYVHLAKHDRAIANIT